jgi:hypothetical protein
MEDGSSFSLLLYVYLISRQSNGYLAILHQNAFTRAVNTIIVLAMDIIQPVWSLSHVTNDYSD